MLYTHAMEEFLKHLEMTDKSRQTIIGYEKELRYMNNFLTVKHNCPVYMDDITLRDIESYMFYKKKKGLASSSRRRAVYILRSFYNYCCKKNICNKNLPGMLEPIKVKEKERSFISIEEFEELTSAINQPVIKTVGIIKDEQSQTPETITQTTEEKPPETIEDYMPFIRFLYEKRDEIYQLLSGTKDNGKIPRYALPGIRITVPGTHLYTY